MGTFVTQSDDPSGFIGSARAVTNALIGAVLDLRTAVKAGSAPARVFARCDASGSQHIGASAEDPINFDTVVDDTHSAVTTGAAWKWTCPVAGIYQVSVALQVLASGAALNTVSAYVFKNGSAFQPVGLDKLNSAAAQYANAGGSLAMNLLVGDYLNWASICVAAQDTVSGGTITIVKVSV